MHLHLPFLHPSPPHTHTHTHTPNSLRLRGSRLIVLRGKPEEVLPKAFADWGITQLCYEVDVEPYALRRDAAIAALATGAGVEVAPFVSHTLYVSMLARGWCGVCGGGGEGA